MHRPSRTARPSRRSLAPPAWPCHKATPTEVPALSHLSRTLGGTPPLPPPLAQACRRFGESLLRLREAQKDVHKLLGLGSDLLRKSLNQAAGHTSPSPAPQETDRPDFERRSYPVTKGRPGGKLPQGKLAARSRGEVPGLPFLCCLAEATRRDYSRHFRISMRFPSMGSTDETAGTSTGSRLKRSSRAHSPEDTSSGSLVGNHRKGGIPV